MTPTYESNDTHHIVAACGHDVEAGDTVTDVAGITVCIDCWNDTVRARRGRPEHNPYLTDCKCEFCERQNARKANYRRTAYGTRIY